MGGCILVGWVGLVVRVGGDGWVGVVVVLCGVGGCMM